MHRYVDLHYQYLTSSYACMLSCPISLRPFVILEGTGLGPRGAQGQSGEGVCVTSSTHLVPALSVCCMRSVKSFSAVALDVDFPSCPKWIIFISLVVLKFPLPLIAGAQACVSQISQIFEQINIWFSFTQNYALNVIVWVHVPFLCHYRENVRVPKRKVRGSIWPQIVHSSACVCSVGVALSALTKTTWCTLSSICSPYIWLVFITFPLTIHLDS